ncbi:MAG: DNA polymerase III subunit epsilon, partial [Marinilabiliales bacterium]
AQIEKYEDVVYTDKKGETTKPVKNDIKALADFSSHHKDVDLMGQIVYNDKKEETFNFGKHKGKTVKEVFLNEPSYYGWMMNADFPLYTKKIITRIKLKMGVL